MRRPIGTYFVETFRFSKGKVDPFFKLLEVFFAEVNFGPSRISTLTNRGLLYYSARLPKWLAIKKKIASIILAKNCYCHELVS